MIPAFSWFYDFSLLRDLCRLRELQRVTQDREVKQHLVTLDWVTQSIQAEKLLPERHFRPVNECNTESKLSAFSCLGQFEFPLHPFLEVSKLAQRDWKGYQDSSIMNASLPRGKFPVFNLLLKKSCLERISSWFYYHFHGYSARPLFKKVGNEFFIVCYLCLSYYKQCMRSYKN